MTVAQINDEFRRRIVPLYGKGEADAMLRLVWSHVRGWEPVDLVLHRDDEVGVSTVESIRAIAGRLEKYEPLQYILGEANFFGLRLKVNRDTLIPRPETEGLVQLILDDFGSRSDLRVVDIGTGSGAIALALARNLPFAKVTAVDISDGALNVARENARRLRCNVRFVKADILADRRLDGRYDIVVSNPPYVLDSERKGMDSNVLDYEPDSAIFAPEADPVEFYRVISKAAAEALTDGGGLYFELNPLTAEEVRRIVEADGFRDVDLLRDIHGRIRFLRARK